MPGIEGLRAIAAVSVLMIHTWKFGAQQPSLGGHGFRIMLNLANGLTLFFVLSGFLLYRPFAAAIAGIGPWPKVKSYARNRALRVYPAYIVAIAGTAWVLQSARVPLEGKDLQIKAMTDPGLLLANFSMLQSLLPSTLFTGIIPARTLTAELCFYIALPLLAFLGVRFAARRVRSDVAVLLPGLVLLAVAGTVKVVLTAIDHPRPTRGGTWGEVLEQSLLAVGDLFAYGMLAAAVLVLLQKREQGLARLRVRFLAAAAVLLVIGVVVTGEIDLRPATSIYGTAAGCLLVGVGLWEGQKSVLMRFLENRVLVFTGLISFSLYLWHEPLIYTLRRHELTVTGSTLGYLADIAIVLTVTGIVATLSYTFVEKPAMRRKRRTDTGDGPVPAPAEPALTTA
jgi:peptidoglycan/LPS O-acetylase OafA/YrhL